jgi:hypothetical protein
MTTNDVKTKNSRMKIATLQPSKMWFLDFVKGNNVTALDIFIAGFDSQMLFN